MNRFLLGALAMGAVFVLTSFALHPAPAAPLGGPAWTVSQYQLDRAFQDQRPARTLSDGPANSGRDHYRSPSPLCLRHVQLDRQRLRGNVRAHIEWLGCSGLETST